MTRIIFVALQTVILVTTLAVAVNLYLFHGLAGTLINALPIEVTLSLGYIGFPGTGDGGGAVCPLTCRGELLTGALSVAAVVLSARRLVERFVGPASWPPHAFGPLERGVAFAGLLLIVLALVAGMLRGYGARVALDMFVRAVSLGTVSSVPKLAHLLIAAAFWIVEFKSALAASRGSRTPKPPRPE